MVPPMTDLWVALAMVLVVEGVLYALFPTAMKQAIARMGTMTADRLRIAGLLMAAVGGLLVWLLRSGA